LLDGIFLLLKLDFLNLILREHIVFLLEKTKLESKLNDSLYLPNSKLHLINARVIFYIAQEVVNLENIRQTKLFDLFVLKF
jgi:hypothetical protein